MKAVLVEDEESVLLVIKKMLSGIPDIEVVGMFQKAVDAYGFLYEHETDIVFIDINLAGESGMELARKMQSAGLNMEIVFLTAFREYTLEAFEVSAFDYIIKPVSQQRLESTVSKIRRKRMNKYRDANAMPRTNNKAAIYCLGGLDVRSDKDKAVKWISSKSIELFSYLLLNKGRLTSRRVILDEVFYGMTKKNAEAYLNTSIYQMRKSLEQHSLKFMIISGMESYGLELEGVYIDYIDFEKRIKDIGAIGMHNINEALEAERMYAGDIFGDRSYLWAISERQRLFEIYATFIKELGMLLIECNKKENAFRLFKKLIDLDEHDEAANILLMRYYAAQKDKSALAKHYERYVKSIHREFGVKPSRNLVNLYAELRIGLD